MFDLGKQALYLAPRVLAIVCVCFLSLFAMDVFDEHLGFWRTMQALGMHLIPALVLIAALILAWRWEWIGAAVYGLAGLLYISWVGVYGGSVATSVRLLWVLNVAGPLFLVAALFEVNWLKHGELHKLK